MTKDDLDNRFSYHPADNSETASTHDAVRTACRDLAEVLDGLTPEGREKSLAITNLEHVMFWANAAVARN